eukprot:SAG31_NODE_13379_length_873_cov_1.722222_1_plen_210_part_10
MLLPSSQASFDARTPSWQTRMTGATWRVNPLETGPAQLQDAAAVHVAGSSPVAAVYRQLPLWPPTTSQAAEDVRSDTALQAVSTALLHVVWSAPAETHVVSSMVDGVTQSEYTHVTDAAHVAPEPESGVYKQFPGAPPTASQAVLSESSVTSEHATSTADSQRVRSSLSAEHISSVTVVGPEHFSGDLAGAGGGGGSTGIHSVGTDPLMC